MTSIIRRRLSYANVMSTIAVVPTIGGASAMAAVVLGPHSVGARQLKKNAVTGVKIKDGAVSSAEVRNGAIGADELASGAVNGDKLASGSVTADKLAPNGLLPGGAQVAHRLIGTSLVEFPLLPSPEVTYQFDNPTYTQPAGEDDLYLGEYQVTFPDSCPIPRIAQALLFIDAPGSLREKEFVGAGEIQNNVPGEVTVSGQFNAATPRDSTLTPVRDATLAPASATRHTFSIMLRSASCRGVAMTGARVDVIGIK